MNGLDDLVSVVIPVNSRLMVETAVVFAYFLPKSTTSSTPKRHLSLRTHRYPITNAATTTFASQYI